MLNAEGRERQTEREKEVMNDKMIAVGTQLSAFS
jgi:hypothetical protein